MPTNALVSAIRTVQQERGLSNAALAKSLDVALSSFTTVLQGKGVPNARTAEKYARLLGVSADEVKAMASRKAGKAPKAAPAKAEKAPKAAKAPKGKPGRPRKSAVVADQTITLSEAFDILSDELCLAVHRAGKKDRALIASLLGA
jgi:ribosome-binding protein aMBF1 (putative translation factor)